jgi:hypothetical protein
MASRLLNRLRRAVRGGSTEKEWLRRRIEMTCGCRDADAIPKVAGAGQVFVRDGMRIQRMHQGVLVPADGYFGPWMTEIIERLRGHHEPQEELLFHHLLGHCRPGTRMLEIGAFWAYYSAWFLSAVEGSSAVCLEPDSGNADCGRATLALNGLSARWIEAGAGMSFVPGPGGVHGNGARSDGRTFHDMSSLRSLVGPDPFEVLHVDAQGAELPFIRSLAVTGAVGIVRFAVVSTHHASISGSASTHADCLRAIESLGGAILAEHRVDESFSGDGLIVASFDPADRTIELPPISRNLPTRSLFGPDPGRAGH